MNVILIILEFDKENFDNITLAMACPENMKGKSQLYDLDSDTFLESVLNLNGIRFMLSIFLLKTEG